MGLQSQQVRFGSRSLMRPSESIALTNTPQAIAFLGAVVPQEMCIQTPACSAGTNKDMLRLIRALRDASGAELTVFSVRPIGVYPVSRTLVIPAERLDLGHGITCQSIPFLNVIFVKQLTILIATAFYLLAWGWKCRDRSRYVLVHNLYPPMALPVLLTKLLAGRSIAFVTDIPHDLCLNFRGWAGLLRRFNLWVEKRALACFSGVVAYTRFIPEDFSPLRPMLVMEGGVEPDDANFPADTASVVAAKTERILLFSGTLSEINGIELLLAAFSRLSNPDYRLWIFGRGPLEPSVREAAARDKRITFFGFVPSQKDVLRRQRQATVLINLRLHDDRINRYTFPGKLREYMVSGRPVISTNAPSIPQEYLDHLYILETETADGLARLIEAVCARPTAELDDFGRRACEFVVRNKSWALQAQRVYAFIRTL